MNDKYWVPGFGLIFYFFDDPTVIRRKLIAVLDDLAGLVSVPFTRIHTESGRFRRFSDDWRAKLTRTLTESSFESAEYIRLTDSTKDTAGSQKLVFMGRRIMDWFPKKTPNYLYLGINRETDKDLLWNSFQNAFISHSFHLAFGHNVVSRNDELLPSSGSRAVKATLESPQWTNEPESTWMSLSYLERVTDSIDGPAEFLGLGPSFSGKLALAVVHQSGTGVDLGAEMGEDYVLFRMSRPEQLHATYSLLRDQIADYEKPPRYWNEKTWNTWREAARKEIGTAK